ncbi:SNF2 family N-terminal domain-containing protein [Auriculariales sp. MPI-PUGE-AT-0066]|nr:SNF2 family N-terminal domain-containing protein [Auriculariales sp. MPI-PUGE-AT-0066]
MTTTHIDLTLDDDDDVHVSKRVCTASHYPAYHGPTLASTSNALYASRSLDHPLGPQRAREDPQLQIRAQATLMQHQNMLQQQYQQHQAQLQQQQQFLQQHQHQQQQHHIALPQVSPHSVPPIASSSKMVIDLTDTRTPSPPPRPSFAETPPNTPVCIGQLTVTALVLYPVDYLKIDPRALPPNPLADEWASVRLRCEDPDKRKNGEETIHIHVPQIRLPDGQVCGGEGFGVVEQKVANTLGPMLAKALIKVDARVRRAIALPPILPLEMLVFTPKGNIQIVAGYLKNAGLLLDHPAADNSVRLGSILYSNPHNPPPGGFRTGTGRGPGQIASRWTGTAATNARNVEVQRSQVDELFKNMQGGDDLPETEPCTSQEIRLPNGRSSSMWQQRQDPFGQQVFVNIVTQKETRERPAESRAALLADDMGLGKTISCVSLVAATLQHAKEFGSQPLEIASLSRSFDSMAAVPAASHLAGSVWGMPELAPASHPVKDSKKKAAEKRAEEEHARACMLKTRSRGTLIICPLSTVSNWEDQFREHWGGEVTVVGGPSGTAPTAPSTPGASMNTTLLQRAINEVGESSTRASSPGCSYRKQGTPLRVYIYHGNARRPDPHFLADFDVVLTTYSTLASEYSKQTRCAAAVDDDDTNSDNGIALIDLNGDHKKPVKKRKPKIAPGTDATSPLQMVHWFRVVLDEAHSIKETNTVGCRACCDLIADRRICLTGTPVQNKLDDVFALVKFMRVRPFDEKSQWQEYIGNPVKYGQQLGVARLQALMRCITLRRTKDSKTPDGKPILSLPPRRDELRYLQFDEQEMAIYNSFFDESKAEFAQLTRTNQVMKNYVGILQKILRLRQICDHYQLVEERQTKDFVDTADGVEKILDSIEDNFTMCQAAIVFGLFRESGTTQCSECGVELASSGGDYERDVPDVDPQCIASTAAKRGRKPKNPPPSTRASSPTGPPSPRPVITRCRHLFCVPCFKHHTAYAEWPEPPPAGIPPEFGCTTCQCILTLPGDAIEVSPDATMAYPGVKKKADKKAKRQKGQVDLQTFHASTKVNSLLSDLVQSSKLNPHSVNYDKDMVELEVVDSSGNRTDDGIVKSVVFSQWTSMLDKIEDALELAGIQYDRLDGTMKRDDRVKAMDALKHNPACEVLLVSLRAGGVGLNLTSAQRVYLIDPYWNPAVENQAVDRIHRLGQTKPVTTIKLIIENSIEARLLEVQKKKTDIANLTLSGTSGASSKAELMQHRLRELQTLFGN